MRSFRFDPYLWVHLAGVAAVPVLLELCLIGLATGEPFFATWFELLFVGGIGILPILWMQWQKPFSIFSLLIFALKPKQLTDDQRRMLRLFKSPIQRVLAVVVAVLMGWVLWQLYAIAPLAISLPDGFPSVNRGVALLVAAIAFLGSNLFLQVPVSVLAVLFTRSSQFAAVEPYPLEQIPTDFTLPGIRVGKLLPPLIAAPPFESSPSGVSPSGASPAEEFTTSNAETAIEPQPSHSSATEEATISSDLSGISNGANGANGPSNGTSARTSTNDSAVTAVEITEEDGVPDEFDDDDDAVTEDVDVMPDFIAAIEEKLGTSQKTTPSQPIAEESIAETIELPENSEDRADNLGEGENDEGRSDQVESDAEESAIPEIFPEALLDNAPLTEDEPEESVSEQDVSVRVEVVEIIETVEIIESVELIEDEGATETETDTDSHSDEEE